MQQSYSEIAPKTDEITEKLGAFAEVYAVEYQGVQYAYYGLSEDGSGKHEWRNADNGAIFTNKREPIFGSVPFIFDGTEYKACSHGLGVVSKYGTAFDYASGTDAKIGTPASGQAATLFGAIANCGGYPQSDVDYLADKFRAVGIAVPQGVTLTQLADYVSEWRLYVSGIEYDHAMETMGDLFANSSSLTSIYTTITRIGVSFPYVNLTELIAPNFSSCVNMPFKDILLRRLVAPKWAPCGARFNNWFSGSSNLIDIEFGERFSNWADFNNQAYNPTNAMLTSTSNLVPDEYKTDYPNNRAYWNYNLRRHFAANLPDRTGETAYTITFGSTIFVGYGASHDRRIYGKELDFSIVRI